MTLVVSSVAAVIATTVWYLLKRKGADTCKTVALVYMFWGASLMWLVDLIFEFAAEGAGVFTPGESATPEDWQTFYYKQTNDLFLGFAVVALALVIWVVIWIISDVKKRNAQKNFDK